jgi:hypothetical protein
MTRYLYKNGYLQDGKLDSNTGRIVIYQNYILHSEGPARDHNDLLRSLAAKFRLDKDEVISRALRFYYTRQRDAGNNRVIIISPVRKLDDEDFLRDQKRYAALITGEVK